jgi:FkbH-like protein
LVDGVSGVLLMGRCGLERLAEPLRARTGVEVTVCAWSDSRLPRARPWDLIYVDLFDWDSVAPRLHGHAGLGTSVAALRAQVASLHGLPVVYRGLRLPMAGNAGLTLLPAALPPSVQELAGLVRGERVLDIQGLWARQGIVTDDVPFGSGHGEAGQPGAEAEARHLHALWTARVRGPRKVLVLDLDHTLIHGLLAADDFTALNPAWGGERGALEAWWRLKRGLHEAVRVVQARGVMLALVTRNPPSLVADRFVRRSAVPDAQPGPYAWMYEDLPPELSEAAFHAHPEMLRLALDRHDFLHIDAGFGERSAALARIADALGVGLGDLALVDDSPYERAEVAENAPEVALIQEPWREDLLLGAAFTVWDQPALRREDSIASRQALLAADAPLDFLHGLEVAVGVRRAVPSDLPRVRQLVQRVNQLSLNGARPEIAPTDRVYLAWCRDRLADHGVVAAGIFRDDRLIAWVCSCRVMPHQVAPTILHLMRAQEPDAQVTRVATPRNGATLGVVEEADEGVAAWVTVS